jgi:hypothetical protein
LAIGVDINGSPPADGEVGTKESGVAKHKESA